VWYEHAAQLGNVQAMCRMGDMERDGERGTPNAEAAFSWYLKAAKAGYPPAMEYVASCYFYGRGVAADLKEAARWYQKAAELSCELTPQQIVSLERVLSAAAREAALQADGEHQRPADKR
jgi:TPR repeat protein